MTLQELIAGVLQELHRASDTATVAEWRPRLTVYINEALTDVTVALRPWRREAVQIVDGRVDTTVLSRKCAKALELRIGGQRRPFYYGGEESSLCVPGTKDATAELCYRYTPPPLAELTDVPDLPAECHALLITYAAARERMQMDGVSQNAASIGFSLYETQRRRARAGSGEAIGYSIFNS
ncbi:MAG: hypothetical protein FWF10_01750 [Clostridiales bacterium]|nr:hypothetical protein [Clostridiales bacterium]